MYSDVVSAVERIAILFRLVIQYLPTIGVINAVKLAKDVAITLDEIDHHNVRLDKLADDFFMLFSGHWKERTQFLLIVTKHWPHIVKELGKSSVERIPTKSSYHTSNFECCTADLRTQFDIQHITNKIHVFEAPSLLAEVDFIADIITSNPDRTVSIVVPSLEIHDLLLCALHVRQIDFTSYIRNEIRELPHEFLEEIDAAFSDVPHAERRGILRELANVANVVKHHKLVEIIGISDIKFLRSDIVILAELNEDSWSHTDSGGYWLHSLLRHKANLPVSNNISIMEDSFYSCFCGDAEIYMLRATKSAGSSKGKSPILAKFETICKKYKRPLDYITTAQETGNTAVATVVQSPAAFRIPPEIRAEDVELLICDPQAFYVKNTLNLRPPDLDKERCELLMILKNFMRSCLHSVEQTIMWLEKIRDIDMLLYYRCLSIPEWVTSHLSRASTINNIHGETHIPKFSLALLGNCDIVRTEGRNATLIEFSVVSAPRLTKNIVLGLETPAMSLCYIAEKGGFAGLRVPISEVQIWSISRPATHGNNTPIEVTTIHVSSDMIAAFEATLYSVLSGCGAFAESASSKKSDKYRHIKRRG
jgi:hypothetical protein